MPPPPNEEQLETTREVLQYFFEHEGQYRSRKNRPLRKVLRKIFRREQSMYFGGRSIDEYVAIKVNQKVKSILGNADKTKINRCRLRAERIKQRNKLALKTSAARAYVLDGTVVTRRSKSSQSASASASATPSEGPSDPFAAIVQKPKQCYICKRMYHKLHQFYDQLCPKCAELNWTKRHQTADLNGKVCLVTGGRVKIGFQTVLKLLRAGSNVIVTSRFPYDAAYRYSKEKDFEHWKDKIAIYGLDFRNICSVENFCSFLLSNLERLDAIINNATQTVRRPAAYYNTVVDLDPNAISKLPDDVIKIVNRQPRPQGQTDQSQALATTFSTSALMSQVPILPEDESRNDEVLPADHFDVNNQQLDLRTVNSWVLKLDQVPTGELAEVFAINSIAPFVFNSKLKPLMVRTEVDKPKFIVNVSAMEGKFNRFKNPNHPHTNMAKAAVNMMTRTSAQDYVQDNIYMTSVDTGWINDENPVQIAHERMVRENFQPPLDEIDAAARILDPVMVGSNGGELMYGTFLKDYKETDW